MLIDWLWEMRKREIKDDAKEVSLSNYSRLKENRLGEEGKVIGFDY